MFRSIVWAAILFVSIAAPSFAANRPLLTDQRGERFSFESLRGEPLVVTFVSAHCKSACPLVEAQIARAADALEHRPFALRFLTITLDPAHDSAADMRHLADMLGAKRSRWIFATGDAAYIHSLMRRFGVAVASSHGSSDPSHSTLVYLLDARLRVQRTFMPSGDLSTTLVESVTQ